MKRHTKVAWLSMLPVAVFLAYLPVAIAQSPAEPGAALSNPEVAKWAYLAAAISMGLGCLAAGLAVAYVGSAAIGGVTEKPEMFGRALVFVGLAEGIAIYGLIIAIMILGKV